MLSLRYDIKRMAYMRYDLLVIGGGPAGMMAAGRAAEMGARVLLVEKNDRLGVKLLITGKGRCNITHKDDNIRELAGAFGKNGKFLFSAFSRFGYAETIDFFEHWGVRTKLERGNRIFPASDRAADVRDALLKYMKAGRVKIMTQAAVSKFVKKNSRIEKAVLKSGEDIFADKFVICVGGASYPATGSSGDGYGWLKRLGHGVSGIRPALAPIELKEKYVKDLEGLSLANVSVSVFKNDRKIDSRFGEALFTSNGMSGPVILDMSKKIGDNLDSPLKLRIDLKPALGFPELDKRIQRDIAEIPNKMFKNSLDRLLPKKMIPVMILLSRIDPNKKVNLITKEERKRLLHLLKELSFEIKKVAGLDQAIVTAGGAELKDIDPKTMRSKPVENLYLAGEILDIDGPTGGYNLQACWSTGYVAGQSAAEA